MISFLKYRLFELLRICKKPKPISTSQTQCFYGRVNSWACGKKSVLEKDLNNCVKYGVTGYAIELIGWTAKQEIYRSESYYKTLRDRYKYLVNACRARGLWLFVSVVNDNAGRDGKNPYNPALDKQKANVEFAFDLVVKNGSKNVVVQTVAETHNAYAEGLDKRWIPELNSRGFQTVYNGAYGSPSGVKYGATWYAVHPSSARRKVPNVAWVVSDHSLLLKELGAFTNNKANANAVKEWKEYYKNSFRNPVVCLYHYVYDGSKGSDKAAIKAMGK